MGKIIRRVICTKCDIECSLVYFTPNHLDYQHMRILHTQFCPFCYTLYDVLNSRELKLGEKDVI